jgi:hypothetical protein
MPKERPTRFVSKSNLCFTLILWKFKACFLLKLIAILDQLDLYKIFVMFPLCYTIFLVKRKHDPQQLVLERSSRYMFFDFQQVEFGYACRLCWIFISTASMKLSVCSSTLNMFINM